MASLMIWVRLTGEFIARRMQGTSRRPAHIAEVAVTSALNLRLPSTGDFAARLSTACGFSSGNRPGVSALTTQWMRCADTSAPVTTSRGTP